MIINMKEMAEAKAKANSLEKSMTNVESVFPSIFQESAVMPTVVYQDWQGGAVKGVGTEEFWLAPPYGRPRNIDYNTLKKFEFSEWVQMCVGAIVDAVSQAEYDIVPMKKGDKPSEHEIDEPLTFLEHLPSEESFDQIMSRVLPDILWYDCGAITKVFPIGSFDDNGNLVADPGPPIDLHVIDGRSVMIDAPPVGNRWRRFWQYSWMSPTSVPTPFDTREMMYIQMRPNSRGVYGTSSLEVVQNTVNYLLDSTLATSKYWENGIHIGGQIDFPDVQDVEELKKRAKMIKSELQGSQRYNKWMVTNGNVKITPLQFTPQQMQWLDSQRWFSKIVMGIFKVAPSELGFTEDLNRATGIQQMNIYKSKALYPIMRRIERVINQQLIWADFSPRVKFQFRREMDYEDQIKQLEIYASKVNNNFWSVNQVREDMGLELWEPAFDSPMSVTQQKIQPAMPNIFQQEGQGSEQIGAEEGEKIGKAVTVGAKSGQPGFAFAPRVWDGQKIDRFIAPQRKKLQEQVKRAAEDDRKRVIEELKRRYALNYEVK